MTQDELLLAEQIFSIFEEKYIKQQRGKLIPIIPGVYVILEPRVGNIYFNPGSNHYSIQIFIGDMNGMKADGVSLHILPGLKCHRYSELKKDNYTNKYSGIEFFFEHLFTFFKSKDEITLFIHELMIELI